jgi:4-hydroxybenzoate polyprenyltransferase
VDQTASQQEQRVSIFGRVRQILEMIRFSHTLFALPFALLAAIMAWATPAIDGSSVVFRWRDLAGILFCMVTARSAAMAFNRIVDRGIDARNPRTARRHLPAGLLSPGAVVLFTILCAAGFVLSTLCFLPNRLPLFGSLPVLALLLGYSFAKRFTALSHFWLGTALMLAPVAAWIAVRGSFVLENPRDLLPALWLGTAVLLWVGGFDIIYACQDAEFDRQAKLYSIPARFGVPAALRIAALSHLGMLIMLFTLPLTPDLGGPRLALGTIYWIGAVFVACLLSYEHWIVRPDDLTRVNTAFFRVNAVVSLGLLVLVTIDLFC